MSYLAFAKNESPVAGNMTMPSVTALTALANDPQSDLSKLDPEALEQVAHIDDETTYEMHL